MADCKRKTANLWDGTAYNLGISTVNGEILSASNRYAIYVPVEDNTSYTISRTVGASTYFYYGFTDTLPAAGVICSPYGDMSRSATTYTVANTNHKYLVIFFGGGMSTDIMVNSGSQPLPYEPYGWVHSLRKLTTATDTITTLPADIYADGTNATIGLKGNMSQSGTPSPTTPIQPQECGDRTENLFDKDKQAGSIYVTETATRYGVEIPVEAGIYTVVGGTNKLFVKEKYGTTYGTAIDTSVRRNITLPQNGYILIYAGNVEDYTVSNIMLNLGSTAKPYEPYGYKILISSANTTTPVYLGEVETMRKIKKLVLTGNETGWAKNDNIAQSNAYYRSVSGYYRYNGLCSHYATVDSVTSETGIFFGGNINFLTALYDEIDTVDKWKSYLQQQYANGTPVTIWYVLATAETGIVNEPIRKIGDYADTVSGITIPTITGKDTVDVETTLKPSEVDLNYTGWHDASVKEKSENFAYDILVQDLQPVYSIVLLFSADLEPDTTYTLSFDSISGFYFYINEQVFNVKYINTVTGRNQVICTTKSTLDKSDNRQYLNGRWIILKNAMSQPTNIDITNVMLNSGSTALPYEPYWK